jgi:glycogen phosphorylase
MRADWASWRAIRAAADLEVPMMAVTLLHPQGYFYQRLEARGRQSEGPVHWSVEHDLAPRAPRVTVTVASRPVQIRAWRSQVGGVTGFQVPVYLLDTDLPEHTPDDRTLTPVLSGGDSAYRLGQEMVLGLGGVRMLRALGYQPVTRFHMNEGHAALLVLALRRTACRCWAWSAGDASVPGDGADPVGLYDPHARAGGP